MPNQTHQLKLTRVFRALTDPTRRAVLERLTGGPVSMSELARPFKMALPSFAQHLAVLARCGLIRSTKSGRVRMIQLVPKPLDAAKHWLEKQRILWEQRLNQLDRYLSESHED